MAPKRDVSKRRCRVCGSVWWEVVGVRSSCPYKARHYPAPAVPLADLTDKQAYRELARRWRIAMQPLNR